MQKKDTIFRVHFQIRNTKQNGNFRKHIWQIPPLLDWYFISVEMITVINLKKGGSTCSAACVYFALRLIHFLCMPCLAMVDREKDNCSLMLSLFEHRTQHKYLSFQLAYFTNSNPPSIIYLP